MKTRAACLMSCLPSHARTLSTTKVISPTVPPAPLVIPRFHLWLQTSCPIMVALYRVGMFGFCVSQMSGVSFQVALLELSNGWTDGGNLGNLRSLNELAKTANAQHIIHTGDFGFYDDSSLERIAEK